MKKLGIMLALLLYAGSLAALLGPESKHQAQEKLVLTGSSTVATLALEIAKRFESLNSSVRIDVQTGGSSRGINGARSGLADIGMASRALKEDEKYLFSFTIALDGISLIINRENPVESLAKQQVIDIYTGKIAIGATSVVMTHALLSSTRQKDVQL